MSRPAEAWTMLFDRSMRSLLFVATGLLLLSACSSGEPPGEAVDPPASAAPRAERVYDAPTSEIDTPCRPRDPTLEDPSAIVIEGVPTPSIMCNAMECSPSCCVGCVSDTSCPLTVNDEKGRRVCLRGTGFRASGNSCRMQCHQIACDTHRRYRFVGHRMVDTGGYLDGQLLEVESVCLVD